MKKYFNTAGPCNANEHYILPSQNRCKGLFDLIEQKQYLVIQAARQSGKTTLLLDIVKKLNESGQYAALYCSLESVQNIDDPKEGIPAIVRSLRKEIEFNKAAEEYKFAEKADYSDFNNVLEKELIYLCQNIDKPVIIMFDEVDCLSNGTLITFLRQLRGGYVNRDRIPFVHSIGLCGMRNIRDYKAKIRDHSQSLGSASPFNIVTEVFTFKNFTLEEIRSLYVQHTSQTGQNFTEDVLKEIYHYTKGQPWLVNALAREIIVKILDSNFSQKIELKHVKQAASTIIKRRDTHIDSLIERLREKRVKKIIEPLILGKSEGFDLLDDDYQYALDLGLVCLSEGKLVPSNPIYSEVIIRTLSFRSQSQMSNLDFPLPAPEYLKGTRLDMKKFLTDFQNFWRENSEIWVEKYDYKEAAPHLILQAFLQRIINHSGSITRDFGAGRGRLDLCLHYDGYTYPIELKIRYCPKTYKEGKEQILTYMDKLGCKEGWLIVFDTRKTVMWEDKIFWEVEHLDGRTVNIVGG